MVHALKEVNTGSGICRPEVCHISCLKLIAASGNIKIPVIVELCYTSGWIGNAYSMDSKNSAPNFQEEKLYHEL